MKFLPLLLGAVIMTRLTTLTLTLLITTAAFAATDEENCQKAKLINLGKLELCLQKERAKEVTGKTPNIEKCKLKYDIGVLKADKKAAKKGASCRWLDNGDGTVTDLETGLMWQQTDNSGGLTDTDSVYTWSDGGGGFTEPDGTAFTEFLYGLNDCESGDGAAVVGGYAGYCDWRMPQIGELLTIADCSFGAPCIDESVFGDTTPQGYWSASTDDSWSLYVWGASFSVGSSYTIHKGVVARVRAVRGGS